MTAYKEPLGLDWIGRITFYFSGWKLTNTNFGIEPKMKRSWIHTVGNVDGVGTERIGNVVYGGGGDYEGVGGINGGGFWKRGGDGGSGKEVVVVALLHKGECIRNTIMVNNVIKTFIKALLYFL